MNEKYTAIAATQEEAINKGLNALGITRDEAIITVEEPGKKGFLGIGQKDAIVVVERKEKTNIIDEFLANEFAEEREAAVKVEAEQAKRKAQQEREATRLETAAYADDTVDDAKEAGAEAQEDEMSTEEMVEGRDPATVEIIEQDNKDEETEPTDATPITDQAAEVTEATIENDDQEAIEAVRVYLKDIIQAMDIKDIEVYTSRVNDNVRYDIETENAGLVIGRHGKVLNGLQTLAQNHMHQLAHSKINVRVDAEKYRERRRNTVESLARRTADKALKTNRRVKLDPMPAHERKQIHRYLNANPKVKTHSEGREPKRYLVVEPAE